jgi:ankyrin repeat protein
MVINIKDISTDLVQIDERYTNFTNLGFAARFSKYGNNFNIIYNNIEFEDINLKDIYNWSPLHDAVVESNRHSTPETVELILKYGFDVNSKNNLENTALILCCQNINIRSNIATLKLLLEYGASINLANIYGNTALIYLIENNNLEAIKLLLKCGAKIAIKNNCNESAINISLEKYNFNSTITQTLLNYNKNIDYKFSNYLDFNFIYKN